MVFPSAEIRWDDTPPQLIMTGLLISNMLICGRSRSVISIMTAEHTTARLTVAMGHTKSKSDFNEGDQHDCDSDQQAHQGKGVKKVIN